MSDSKKPREDREGFKPRKVYQTEIDVQADDIPTAIANVVAAVDNIPLSELPTLYDTIDLDGLETILSSTTSSLRIAFYYHNYRVEVTNDGVITVKTFKGSRRDDKLQL